MRTVLLGTSQFAAAVLDRLAQGPHRSALVVSRPDRPAGRGRRMQSPPVASLARELGIELVQPPSVNDEATAATVAAARPDAVLVCAFGALVKEPLLSGYELLNVHPSLLPRWRGAAPVERAIMAGDDQTGVSIMKVTAGLDSGPVCLAEREPIRPDDDYGTLAGRLQEMGARLLTEALDTLAAAGSLRFVEQDEAGATYAEKIAAEDRLLDPGRPARELERVVRALHPHVGARLRRADGQPLGVLEARVWQAPDGERSSGGGQARERSSDGRQAPDGERAPAPAPGALVGQGASLLYGTAEGVLELLAVKPPGGRPMSGADYLRGHAL